MQMARLLDPTRGPKEYSLSKLTAYYERDLKSTKTQIIDNLLNSSEINESQRKMLQLFQREFLPVNLKVNMSKIFERRKVLKNGELGKTIEVRGSDVRCRVSWRCIPARIWSRNG
jgi:hypothetical protein